MSDPRQLVDRIAAEADATAEQAMPGDAAWTQPNRARSVTVSTRVSPDDLAAIEALADRLDVPVSGLLRGWILAGLAASKDDTVHSAIERLSADVQRLRELVA